MSEAALLTDPTQSILGNYASGCYSATMAMQRSSQEWTFMDEGPHITIGYLLREESRMHV